MKLTKSNKTLQDGSFSNDEDGSINLDNTDLLGQSSEEGFGDSSSGSSDDNKETEDEIAAKETRVVTWLRASVVFALLLAAAIVSVMVHYLLVQSQEDTFVAAFDGEAEKVFAEFT